MEAGTRIQSLVSAPQRSAGSLPALKEGPSGSHPLSPGPSLLGPSTTVGRLALGGQEITSLLGPVPSEAARIPPVPQGFSLGNFVSSLRTTIFNPKLPPGPWALATPEDFPELMEQKAFPQTP